MESTKLQGADPQAVRANKLNLVERLADDLAHEIKNPLHSMVINLEVLKRRIARFPEDQTQELMRYVGVLSGELDRVNRRVDLLLRMVRPDRGGEPVSLAQMVEELLELLELERERQGVTVEYHPDYHPVPGRLPRDSARQIVLNLLLLALEAAGAGGVLAVTSETGGGEERLRLLVTPAVGPNGDRSAVNGVEEERSRLATIHALGGAFGGRLDVGAAEEGMQGKQYVFTLAAEPA